MFFKFNKRRLTLIGIDTLVFVIVYAFSVFLEFISYRDMKLELIIKNLGVFALNFAVFITVIFAVRLIAKTYQNVWRYANSRAYLELVFADT